MSRATRLVHFGLIGVLMTCRGTPAIAAQYHLEVSRGADRPVCQAYARGRNATGDGGGSMCSVGRPLRSDLISRPIVPLTTYLVTSNFRAGDDESDLPDSLSAVYFGQIEPFSRRHDVRLSLYFEGASPRDWRGTPDQVRRAESEVRRFTLDRLLGGSVDVIELDVDNDGRTEPVFFYPRTNVEKSDSLQVETIGSPIVLSADRRTVDERRTMRIFRSPVPYDRTSNWRTLPDGTDVRVRDFLVGSNFGVFRYAGKTFIDFQWAGSGYPLRAASPEKGTKRPIRVFLATRDRVTQVCELLCTEASSP